VESGDTLGRIALRTLGSSRRASDIARHNGFDLEDPIRVGQVLRLPAAAAPATSGATPPVARAPATTARSPAPAAVPAPATGRDARDRRRHRVSPGENYYRIAVMHYGSGGRWREIASANGLDPEDPLPVGRELVIP
jgi:nucleoid-associated protein YgaU